MQQINIDGVSSPIEVIRRRRKTLGVKIDRSGKIIALIPIRATIKETKAFLSSESKWIERTYRKTLEALAQAETEGYFTEAELEAMTEKARVLITERVKHYAPLIGVTYGRITIRKQRSRWGSCSAEGNLSFNCLLAEVPPPVLDSVVVHELCHRKQMNHSKAFYYEVRKVFPEYDKHHKWLKENGTRLICRMTGE